MGSGSSITLKQSKGIFDGALLTGSIKAYLTGTSNTSTATIFRSGCQLLKDTNSQTLSDANSRSIYFGQLLGMLSTFVSIGASVMGPAAPALHGLALALQGTGLLLEFAPQAAEKVFDYLENVTPEVKENVALSEQGIPSCNRMTLQWAKNKADNYSGEALDLWNDLLSSSLYKKVIQPGPHAELISTLIKNPKYKNELLDIYDFFEQKIKFLRSMGIKHNNIMIDPGIGFGKNLKHYINLIRSISIFHTLGFPILLGLSRKRFIKDLSGKNDSKERLGGTVASSMYAIMQGVQVLRIHDVNELRQSIKVFKELIKN